MLLNNIKFNTIAVFLWSIVFTWFFFHCKHDLQLSKVNVFNVDPYDAVGSIAIQISLLASLFSMIRLSLPSFTRVLPDFQVVMILRGNTVALISIIITMISNIIALIRFSESWTKNPSGFILLILVISFLLITVLIILWTLKLAVAKSIKVEYKPSLNNILSLSGFAVLALFPVLLHESIPWAIFTAYSGMLIQILIVRNISFTMLPQSERIYPDLIDVFKELYKTVKSNLILVRTFLEKVEGRLNTGKTSAFISWLNPRKHDWNLIILIAILSGVGLAVLEAIGEEWIGFNTKALLLFSIYFGGELLIIVLFYRLFRNFLGIVNK
jgi:hypothetical protein